VQGVYFRASAAARANELGVRGSAENQPDGSVLVHAAGSAAALEDFARWLRHGPPMARVDAIDAEEIDPAAVTWPAGFVQK
jgi:acylphosphatase